jgi:hypothetical protein
MTKPIEAFDYDRNFEEWSEEELDELFDALSETDTPFGEWLRTVRGDQS